MIFFSLLKKFLKVTYLQMTAINITKLFCLTFLLICFCFVLDVSRDGKVRYVTNARDTQDASMAAV